MLTKILKPIFKPILSPVLSVNVPLEWTPFDLTEGSHWWDFSDINSIEKTGNASSRVLNQLTDNHLVQLTGINQPTTGIDSHNGLNVLTFNGMGQGFNLTETILGNNITVFCVAKGNGFLYSHSTRRTAFSQNDGNLVWDNTAGFGSTPVNIRDKDSYQILEFTKDGINSILKVNGQTDLILPVYQNIEISRIGLKWDSATSLITWAGQIGDFIITPDVSQEDNILTFLSKKWGITLG